MCCCQVSGDQQDELRTFGRRNFAGSSHITRVLEGVALFLLIAAVQADVQHPFAPADRRIAR
jgi:hypothetical protein